MSFFIGNQDKFLTNSSVHSTNKRNKHRIYRPIADVSCFQKSAFYSGIRIFNNPPQSITSLRNEKLQYKLTLKFIYTHTPFTLWMNFLHVQMICITELCDCVNSYTVIILYVLFTFVCFLTRSTSYCLVTASGIYGMYICMYLVCMYICMYVCLRTYVCRCLVCM